MYACVYDMVIIEFHDRQAASGWKFDVPLASVTETVKLFKQSFLCGMGFAQYFAMEGHLVTKSLDVVKCLLWGTQFYDNGYQTNVVCFLPTGSPISRNPIDPKFL